MPTSGAAVARLNLTELLEGSRIGRLHVRLFVLCMASLVMDGFDVQAIGYVGWATLFFGIDAGLGVGRLGAIVGPHIGGALLQARWAPQQLFWAAALPAFISTLVVVTLRFVLGVAPGAPSAAEPAPLLH